MGVVSYRRKSNPMNTERDTVFGHRLEDCVHEQGGPFSRVFCLTEDLILYLIWERTALTFSDTSRGRVMRGNLINSRSSPYKWRNDGPRSVPILHPLSFQRQQNKKRRPLSPSDLLCCSFFFILKDTVIIL
ncbi:unnamed protein product [Larinioides sclopetarius]|uniref:Uncharacterized protein n=1 Tax=Larinioides sclopetarius TaxID=280406 RepID=A0AAV2AHH1_9ARAC